MDVLILCGGLGTRLRPVIGEKQKVLTSVGGRPFLSILIDYFSRQGFRRFVLCAGYKAGDVDKAVPLTGPDKTVRIVSEPEPLGTGGALRFAAPHIQSEAFLVLNGDSFIRLDTDGFLAFHEKKKAMASVVLKKAHRRDEFGSVVLDETCRIVEFHEKKKAGESGLINAGVYCFTKGVMACFPKGKCLSLERDVFPQLAGGAFFGYRCGGEFLDIGTPERLKQAQDIFNTNEQRHQS